MEKWIKRGVIFGILIGVLGTIITRITGDISVISIPVVILFRGYGLLFTYVIVELIAAVVFYALVGAIVGYIIQGKK